jgi:hypothetical protein
MMLTIYVKCFLSLKKIKLKIKKLIIIGYPFFTKKTRHHATLSLIECGVFNLKLQTVWDRALIFLII